MVTPTWRRLNTITKGMTWREDLKSLKDELMAKGLLGDIPAARAFLDEADALRREHRRCGTPDESPACQVETRYIYQVFRNTPKESVLAQTLFGFELASVDPRVAGINLVGSEDNYAAMADYADHMRIFQLHAGFIPRFISACTLASWRLGSFHRKASVAMCARRWMSRAPTASATGWT